MDEGGKREGRTEIDGKEGARERERERFPVRERTVYPGLYLRAGTEMHHVLLLISQP